MLVGILSDTHDHRDNIKKAVEIFKDRAVEHIIHAGDYVAPFTGSEFYEFIHGFTGVFGNNDGDRLLLNQMYPGMIHNQPYSFELSGKKILLMHEPYRIDEHAASCAYDLIIHGHTHKPYSEMRGCTLILNPGETCGWVSGRATIALLDLSTMIPDILEFR
ncbi:MAG: metallophosphoesterase [Dissulfurispiraceae bacterium]|jgi:putative phosphoesterase|nr:metallophosphoesterase [Dissulfurispiraceae bacterium]